MVNGTRVMAKEDANTGLSGFKLVRGVVSVRRFMLQRWLRFEGAQLQVSDEKQHDRRGNTVREICE